MSKPMRIVGLLVLLWMTYGFFSVIYDLFINVDIEKNRTVGVFLLLLIPYVFILLAPPVLINNYPNWVKKILPRWLIIIMYAHTTKEELSSPIPKEIPREK